MTVALVNVRAHDWPQILGPGRNGIYTGPPIVASFPRSGPPQIWARDIGAGFAGPAVSAGTLVLFHRVNNREVVEAMDAATGKTRWTFDYATSYRDDFGFDEGPRAVPVIAATAAFSHTARTAGCMGSISPPAGNCGASTRGGSSMRRKGTSVWPRRRSWTAPA